MAGLSARHNHLVRYYSYEILSHFVTSDVSEATSPEEHMPGDYQAADTLPIQNQGVIIDAIGNTPPATH